MCRGKFRDPVSGWWVGRQPCCNLYCWAICGRAFSSDHDAASSCNLRRNNNWQEVRSWSCLYDEGESCLCAASTLHSLLRQPPHVLHFVYFFLAG